VLHVEQEVVGDDTPALESVLQCDTVREELLRKEREISVSINNGYVFLTTKHLKCVCARACVHVSYAYICSIQFLCVSGLYLSCISCCPVFLMVTGRPYCKV
jgi:hypothetical protein